MIKNNFLRFDIHYKLYENKPMGFDILRRKLKQMVKKREIKIRELALRSGLNKDSLSLILNNKRRFNEDHITKISKALNIPVHELFMDGDQIQNFKMEDEKMRAVRELICDMEVPEIRRGIFAKYDELKQIFKEKVEKNREKKTFNLK